MGSFEQIFSQNKYRYRPITSVSAIFIPRISIISFMPLT